ncbi:MAG TPA: hypothetical protein PLG96_08410, partial [Flexilinea sp.]|nr:hypothetical protein [Flexilinea sp.]
VGITVWLQRTAKHRKAWIATVIPAAFMFVMSTWALVNTFLSYTYVKGAWVMPVGPTKVVPGLSLIYIILAVWVVINVYRQSLRMPNTKTDNRLHRKHNF